ncbi:hypothetical protein ANN_07919 [Periplaneta americana]|uniref:Peptidase S1 domain-containing protein n=1 Tax=Periplaneta americana TaxID=6978 RepID=A0ABQ8T180_PERAM|nr:hypothetical protein ANN_07919 [Periplaneta americana]
MASLCEGDDEPPGSLKAIFVVTSATVRRIHPPLWRVHHRRKVGNLGRALRLPVEPPFEYSKSVQAIPMESSSVADGTIGVATGWGRVETYGRQSDVLLQVSLPVLNYDTCSDNYFDEGFEDVPHHDQMCTLDDGKGTCQREVLLLCPVEDTFLKIIVDIDDDCERPATQNLFRANELCHEGEPRPKKLGRNRVATVKNMLIVMYENGVNISHALPAMKILCCEGDSGGPFVVDGKLVGIHSWEPECGQREYPSIFSNMSYFRGWVKDVTGI